MASKLGKLDSSSNEDGPDGLGCAPALPDYTAKLCMDQKLYFQYFVQDDVEDGTLMDTKIPINEVGHCRFLATGNTQKILTEI